MTNSSPRYALKLFAALAAAAALTGCGSDPAKEYGKGRTAFDNAEYTEAVECFTKVLETEPGNVDALVMLARSEFALGDLAAAKAALNKAALTNKDDVDVIELTAQIAFFQKDYKLASRSYARIASDMSLDAATRSIGWTGMGIVDFVMIGLAPDVTRYRHESRVKFLQAVVLDRRNASARYHLGRLYRDTFQYLDAAKDEFSAYVHLEPVVDDRVRKIKDDVLPSLKKEIAMNSEPTSHVDSPACAAFLKTGDAAFRKKQWKSAITAYSKALKKDPSSFPAAAGLARSYARSDRNKFERDEAMDAYLKACKIRPSAISLYLEAADHAVRTGKFATAVELYSRALAANPSSKPAVEGLISSLTRTGDTLAASVYRGYLRTLSQPKK